MIYADSSALMKMIVLEPESRALRDWLSEREPTLVVSSELAKVEVLRGCHRIDVSLLPPARARIAQVTLIPMSGPVVDVAAELPGRLRSLDAIHLASALIVKEGVTAFLCYDRRLTDAAEDAGLVCVHPGAKT